MARLSIRQSPWMLVLYLVALFASPMLFMGKAEAQGSDINGPSKSSRDSNIQGATLLTLLAQSSVLIWVQHILALVS
jgi:hypothetical protein